MCHTTFKFCNPQRTQSFKTTYVTCCLKYLISIFQALILSAYPVSIKIIKITLTSNIFFYKYARFFFWKPNQIKKINKVLYVCCSFIGRDTCFLRKLWYDYYYKHRSCRIYFHVTVVSSVDTDKIISQWYCGLK